jgi:hypothetical protein
VERERRFRERASFLCRLSSSEDEGEEEHDIVDRGRLERRVIVLVDMYLRLHRRLFEVHKSDDVLADCHSRGDGGGLKILENSMRL